MKSFPVNVTEFVVWWCFYYDVGAIYGSDYIWESSDGVKSLLNVGLLVMSVRELNVNWGQRNENTAGIILLSVGCKMPHMSPISRWNVPVAKNPKVDRSWMCTGVALVRWVSRSNIGWKSWHNSISMFLGNRYLLRSHSVLSLSKSACSLKTRSLRSARFSKIFQKCKIRHGPYFKFSFQVVLSQLSFIACHTNYWNVC